jgi:hypothetical protein
MSDTVIIFLAFSFMCRVQLWADSLSVPYSATTCEVVCSQHFSEADFTSPECIYLNRTVVSTVPVQHPHTHIQHQDLQNFLQCAVTSVALSYTCFQCTVIELLVKEN